MPDRVDQLIDGVQNLPPSPHLMIELLNLLKSPDRDIDQLIEVMSHDPSLTAEILKRCNSAAFGLDEPVTDMFEATFRLGFHEVYRTATTLFGSRLLCWSGSERGRQLDTIWEHSALSAVTAGLIATVLAEGGDAAFVAGLLHDVGKVVFLSSRSAAPLSAAAPSDPDDFEGLTAEKTHFGCDHSEVGARLLRRWGFPDHVTSGVQHHHSPQQADPSTPLAAVLCLADGVAHSLLDETAQLPNSPEIAFCKERLELDDDRLSALRSQAEQEAKRVGDLFHAKA